MRLLAAAATAALALAARPAAAQLSNHSIAVESGLSAPLSGGAGAGAALALAATTWLAGDLEAVGRVALASAPGTQDRAAARAWSGSLGLRLSLSTGRFRPQLSADLGWGRVGGSAGEGSALVLGLGAGLEAFPARDLSVAVRAGLRGAGTALSLDAVLAVAAYF